MSLQLLEKLNGNNNGALLKLINSFKKKNKEPKIAWYPSAGEDFRDVLYLSESYYQKNPIENIELEAPDIFIHTDYYPWKNSRFFDDKTLYADSHTSVWIKHIKELSMLSLPLDAEIVNIPDGNSATNRVIFTILMIYSEKLEMWEIPLIYIFAENATFFHDVALANNSIFHDIINVRYGIVDGGGRSTGIWIKNILKRIGCKLLITDNYYFDESGDLRIYELFPDLKIKDNYTLETIRTTPIISWPGYNDVSWQLVK